MVAMFISSRTSAAAGSGTSSVERLRHGPHREELQRPPDDLEEDRQEGGAGARSTARPCRAIASSRRAVRWPDGGRRRAPRREHADREQAEPDEADDHDACHRPVRQLGGRHHVGDEERDREEVEQPVREHRPEERRARALAVREVTPEHGDARELARAGGEHGVPEQPDAERREDLAEGGLRRRHRLIGSSGSRPTRARAPRAG